jgi:hypothetical protein
MAPFRPPPAPTVLLITGLLLTVGCSDLTLPEGTDPEPATLTSLQILPTLSSRELDLRVPPGSVDRRFLEINRVRSGFAGMYYDLEGELVIRLTSSAPEGGLVQSVEAAFQDDDLRIANHRVLSADFEWQELVDWRLRISSGPQWTDAITAIGIDERRNQIGIGVDDLGAEHEIRERLAELGVPDEAVFLIESPRLSWTGRDASVDGSTIAASSHTLQHRQRPLVGGLRINHSTQNSCTYGAAVGGFTYPAFITASHCTPNPGSVDPFDFHQATVHHLNWFAEEAVDPAILPMTASECVHLSGGGGNGCRHADAVVGSLDHVLPDSISDQSFGVIARTVDRDPVASSLEIDGQFYITGRVNAPLSGQPLEKVGSTTGWTYGAVSHTCWDKQNEFYVWMLCQYSFTGGATGQDSGAPVFHRFAHDYVRIAGLVWLWDVNQNETWFAPMTKLDQHLGALDYGSHTPPPPPNVTIEGPDSILPDATCTWNAVPTSGTSPFTFSWWNYNVHVSDSASYTGGLLPGSTGSTFTLTVEFEDGSGQTGTSQLLVEESPGADPCLI